MLFQTYRFHFTLISLIVIRYSSFVSVSTIRAVALFSVIANDLLFVLEKAYINAGDLAIYLQSVSV